MRARDTLTQHFGSVSRNATSIPQRLRLRPARAEAAAGILIARHVALATPAVAHTTKTNAKCM